MDTRSWGTKFPPRLWNRLRPAGVQRRLLRLRLLQKIIPDVNTDSGPSRFAFHIPPESDFSISRNPYSPFPGTLIHMPRIPHTTNNNLIQFPVKRTY
jgi:hypothetical protein